MSVLPVYLYGTEVLRKKAKPVTKIDNDTIKLIIDMFETMHKAEGIGLAANQVGSLERVIVIDVSDMEGYEEVKPLTLINPEVVERVGTCPMEEGCLSIPEVRDEVERDEQITVKYRDTNFHVQKLEAGGIFARVILHEIDHLDGVLFIDRIAKTKLKLHKDRLKVIRQGEAETSYPVVAAASAVDS